MPLIVLPPTIHPWVELGEWDPLDSGLGLHTIFDYGNVEKSFDGIDPFSEDVIVSVIADAENGVVIGPVVGANEGTEGDVEILDTLL